MFGWLIKHTAVYKSLEEALAREREMHELTRQDRDDYRKRFIDKCEYIAIVDNKPRFNVTDPYERKPIQPEASTWAELDAEMTAQDKLEFAEYLKSHPEPPRQT